jgi:hypothetical protein
MDAGTVVIAVLAVGLVGSQVPGQMDKWRIDGVARSASLQIQEKSLVAQAKAVSSTELVALANERYKTGCKPVLVLGTRDTVSLKVGQPIVDGAYAKLYAPVLGKVAPSVNPAHYAGAGLTVCTPYGQTGVMEVLPNGSYAVVADLATTNDQAVIDAWFARYKGLKTFDLGQR